MKRNRSTRLHRVVDVVAARLAEGTQPRHEAFAIGLGCDRRPVERRPTGV